MGTARQPPASPRLLLIRALTFDVGGTLIHPAPSVGHIYADTAARHGYPGISHLELNRRFAAAWVQLKDFSHTREQWAALVDATFAGLTPALPSATFFPDLYERFARRESWAVFPDVLPALEQLAAAGLKLAVVSNWDERLRPLLRALDLDRWFQTIIVSCEAGCCKPAAAIFQAAARALQTATGEILHVGDSLGMDGIGAQRAGMRATLIQRQLDGIADPEAADVPSVSRLTELPNLVCRL